MRAIGLDLGGTKIETQVFDDAWQVAARRRIETPRDYPDLLACLIKEIRWASDQSPIPLPVGIAAPGLVDPQSGAVLTANLCASGHTLPADIAAAVGRPISYLNDGRAHAVSEAIFGAGRGHRAVMAVILGTGVGGGLAVDGAVFEGPGKVAGEYGHTSAPAHLVSAFELPVLPCGCGRMGCIETYVSGPGLVTLARHMTGQTLTTPEIAARNTAGTAAVWGLWCDLVADLMRTLVLVADPDVIVLGGGLSRIERVAADVGAALDRARLGGVAIPPVALAEGGDTSAARGAAYAAWKGARDG